MSSLFSSALDVLHKFWGYDDFRPMQREIIESVLAGHDTLGLMPTGGGKSLTFQVPGILLPGVTIVVTPLISLMKDQVDNLRRRHIKAVFFHSAMSSAERRRSTDLIFNGRAKFIYVSPERLRNERFIDMVRTLDVSLIVVDEAHCISQWGYDFRPAYLNIARLRKVKPDSPLLALTATATPRVAEDICARLEMRAPRLFRMSFVRSNISYLVRRSATKVNDVLHILSRTSGSAIVYVRSRKRTAEIADYLNAAGIASGHYHAGLSYEVKEERQNAWQTGAIRVMVATNAFGMGIDKPDVRVVIHYDIPPSLEEYYQEAGRAGRDGLTSWAVLLAGPHDQGVLRRRVSEAFPPRDVISKIYERVCNNISVAVEEGYDTLHEFDPERFCRKFEYQDRQLRAALRLLGQAGYMEFIEESDRRSRAMILVDREELYRLHGNMPVNAEQTIDRMLRLYTGLFTDYAVINEDEIARAAKLSSQQVYEALLALNRQGVTSYIPRSRAPMIYLPTAREEASQIRIGKRVYEERRDDMSRRTEAMIDYAFSDRDCRENRMLLYFGEKRADGCGRCDVCRARRQTAQSRRETDLSLIEQVMRLVAESSEGMQSVAIERQLGTRREVLAPVLAFLVGEGHLCVDRGLYRVAK